ncbi:MAG: hypothetical protein COB98_06630 [Flavobacteriaceae bacterium]|nr:MAG: hypothetical protein COB98_06630 [Flavobacteriaceae bacterium]
MKQILFILCILFVTTAEAQTRKIKILSADDTFNNVEKYPGAIVSIGNVFLEHEGATMRCKMAIRYEDDNRLKAIGDVFFNQGDTITQTSDYIEYFGNTKLVKSYGNVILKDPLITLKTDTLYFDRTLQKLYYPTNGTIIDTTNTLKSDRGIYYLKDNKFEALSHVEVFNDENDMVSEKLEYYTDSGIVHIQGPSTIINKKDSTRIYTERGTFNSKTSISHLLKNSKIYFKNRIIQGDSIYYNQPREFSSLTGNIKITDSINKSVIKGGYAELYRFKDSVFITKRAVAISLVGKDSMYVHGKKLMITGKPEHRVLRAFSNVKFFKNDMSGKCDSMHVDQKSGLTQLFKFPVIWAQGNQISGDTIQLLSNPKTEKLDSLKILRNAFMIQKDSTGYNQMAGKRMLGKFIDNDLRKLHVIGNCQVVTYDRNEAQELLAISAIRSSRIEIEMKDKKVQYITHFRSVKGDTYPVKDFPEEKKEIKGFLWRGDEQPLKMEDIFIHDEMAKLLEKTKPKVVQEITPSVKPTISTGDNKPTKGELKKIKRRGIKKIN